jgi:hypothetical protein
MHAQDSVKRAIQQITELAWVQVPTHDPLPSGQGFWRRVYALATSLGLPTWAVGTVRRRT